MPPLFTTSDIAALVAAYPPSQPTRETPTVVRSLLGNNLQSSEIVISRFRKLLETSSGRIQLDSLPESLDIGQRDWLFDVYDDPIYYSADRKSILSKSDIRALLQRLLENTSSSPVDIIAFAHDCDIDGNSLSLLIAEEDKRFPGEIIQYVDCNAGDRKWIYSSQYALAMQRAIALALSSVEVSDTVNLSHGFIFSDAPRSLIHDWTKGVLAKNDKIKGNVELREQSVVFVPADYADAQEQQRKYRYNKQVDELVENFTSQGYCIIPLEIDGYEGDTNQETRVLLLRDVKSRIVEKLATSEILELDNLRSNDGGSAAIISRSYFDELLPADESPESIIAQLLQSRDATKTDAQFKSTVINALATKLIPDPLLASLISTPGTPSYTRLDAIVASSISALEQKNATEFHCILSAQLLAPIILYATGVDKAQDQTLHENLSLFIGDHFRREIIPKTITALRTKNLLLDRTRAKETDKLAQAAASSRSLAELQTAIAKLEKKLKLPPLNAEQLKKTRDQTLRNKATAVQRMTRSSDILQNLLWILLAERVASVETDEQQPLALFMSSGKDTTRMIKLFQAVSDDAVVGARLETWRDKLKAGKESVEDMREMKDWAMKTVNGMNIMESV